MGDFRMNNEDTPLTNQNVIWANSCSYEKKWEMEVCSSEFTRNLERQNNRLRAALNDIACGAACLNGYVIEDAARTAREAIRVEEDAGVVAYRSVHPDGC